MGALIDVEWGLHRFLWYIDVDMIKIKQTITEIISAAVNIK